VTGFWQVSGRSRTTLDETLRVDLRCARSRPLWTDVMIVLRTGPVVGGKGTC
jgi:lipopolysaccharide/colanic/teichoic acid biosynthesis glycosyltransferase